MVSQPPVNLKKRTPIPGFLGSPHNLTPKAFDKVSNNGFFSHVSSIDVKPELPQSLQSVQSSQFVHVGVQVVWGGNGLQYGVAVGVGVGVGVAFIIVPQVCV